MIRNFCKIANDKGRKVVFSQYKLILYGSSASNNAWPSFNGYGPLYFYPVTFPALIALGIETESGLYNSLILLKTSSSIEWIPPVDKITLFRDRGIAINIEDEWYSTVKNDEIHGIPCKLISKDAVDLICHYLIENNIGLITEIKRMAK